MLQKVNRLLTILMFSLIGVFLGYSIYTCADCRTRPGLYALYRYSSSVCQTSACHSCCDAKAQCVA